MLELAGIWSTVIVAPVAFVLGLLAGWVLTSRWRIQKRKVDD